MRFTPYQKRLLIFLSVATFFEGYDFFALTQILPELRQDLHLSEGEAGVMLAVINLGTLLAYVLVRLGDRWGRKRVLTLTILGYSLFTFGSAFAPEVYSFALCQMIARVFLTAEWAISMVYGAEEFPAARRGLVIGLLQGMGSLGAIVCAGVVPLLLTLPWGWRSVYLVAAPPLILVAIARRSIRETARFTRSGPAPARRSLFHILGTAHRRRVVHVGLLWALTYMATATAVTYWKEFAVGERGLSDAEVGAMITIAALGSMPVVFYAGRILDRWGRRLGGAVIYLVAMLGMLGAYNLHGRVALTAALVLAVFGTSAVLPVLNAFTSELFPTDLRADAFAWANSLLGRVGFILSPLVVGYAAGEVGYGPAVSVTVVFPLLALALMLMTMPETRGRELEDTAAIR